MATICSEVSGSVWKIETPVGTSVAPGEVLMIIESMKMEIPVESPSAGIVREIKVAPGEVIREGQALLVLG